MLTRKEESAPLTLIKLAKQLKEADQRGVDLGLNDEEVAFYDALAQNNSAVELMGKDNLKIIATELVAQVRKSVTIDWTLRAVTDAQQLRKSSRAGLAGLSKRPRQNQSLSKAN